jgi:hypothetical protein
VRSPVADAIRALTADVRSPIRVGTVTSTSPLEVALGGQSGLSSARRSSYTATLSDQVLILQSEPDLIILGKIVTGG